jgi:hypothetical protein
MRRPFSSDLIIGLCLLSAGCAPVGIAGFVPGQNPQPVEVSDRPAPSSNTPPTRPVQLLDSRAAPAIANCVAWKDIDRQVYNAPRIAVPQNDVIGDTIGQIQKRGWPEEAAKQLLVVMMAAYSNQPMTEGQFVAEQFENCKRENSRPGPKYPNVTVSTYWSPEKKAEAKAEFERTQHEYTRRAELLSPCLQYKAKAMMVQVYKNKGISIEQAADYTASDAYGPGGIVYRGSQATEALLVRMVRAGYTIDPSFWRDEHGQATANFADFAFARCINGDPF